MSSDFYFRKWKQTLIHLEDLVQLDLEYQSSKEHDKTICAAVMRLTGILGRYNQLHNEALECLQQNLQVQKVHYIADVVKAITKRILELKHNIRKLECSNIQFMGHGLANHKLTPMDAELSEFPPHVKRPEHIELLIEEAFKKSEERKQELRRLALESEQLKNNESRPVTNWWDDEQQEENESYQESITEKESEETLQRKQMAAIIQAHERSRQLRQRRTFQKQKREIWEKALKGTLKPQAPQKIKERSAQLIQKAFRAYFEIKRKRKLQFKEYELLGMQLNRKLNKDPSNNNDELSFDRMQRRKIIELEWRDSCEKLKQEFMKRKLDDVAENYRDFVRCWFRKWFDDIKYFYDIPKQSEIVSVLIMKEELPDPVEWWEQYEQYLADKKSNKNQTAMQKKYEEMQAKEEAMMKKREELIKKKLQTELMRKLMKNPTLHPGYIYPQSKKTNHILEVIKCYNDDWSQLDLLNSLDVKERFVHDVDINNVYAEIRKEIMNAVNDDMREELKLLKKALKNDYENMDEKLPEPMRKGKGRKKKNNKKQKYNISEGIAEKMEDLAFRGIITQYPRTKLEDFLGDHNYAGDDIRCQYEPAYPFSGEIRAVWWDRCREVAHGSHSILIVGPHLSGKTVLVNALASLNDAVLFVLDLSKLQALSTAELLKVSHSVTTCAKAVQPCVIFIRHIHKLYFKKIQPSEYIENSNILRRVLVRKLCKRIKTTDKITVIGTCIDPWLVNSSQLLKQFHTTVLIPDTSYSRVVKLLKQWINDNHSVPADLNVAGLAFVLRGYSYGYLKKALTDFLSPERVVKIAAYGLFPQEIYDYIINDAENKIEYEKYQKWYYDQAHWGKKEKKHIMEQREYKEALIMYQERIKKKNNQQHK